MVKEQKMTQKLVFLAKNHTKTAIYYEIPQKKVKNFCF
jgi:hypothetical protein